MEKDILCNDVELDFEGILLAPLIPYRLDDLVGEVNQYFFGGQIKKESIIGWGFTRYVVSELGPLIGTLMAVDPNASKVDRFIRLSGEPYLIRYNSRLPVVVYVPEGELTVLDVRPIEE